MSASTNAVAGSVERATNHPSEMEDRSQQDIANLAYALWQQRGCPEGSPEEDWLQAEKMIVAHQQE